MRFHLSLVELIPGLTYDERPARSGFDKTLINQFLGCARLDRGFSAGSSPIGFVSFLTLSPAALARIDWPVSYVKSVTWPPASGWMARARSTISSSLIGSRTWPGGSNTICILM
jgi:hypothetical protein